MVAAVQELSLARTLDAVMQIVKVAARQLTGADGATFILREHDFCYYALRDASTGTHSNGVAALYMSGYMNGTISDRGLLAADVRLVEKPFTATSLAQAVRKALDQR